MRKFSCYEKKRHSSKGGKIFIRLVINNRGKVVSASIVSSTISDTSIEQCVLFWIKAIKFPSFKGDAVSETINFVFQ